MKQTDARGDVLPSGMDGRGPWDVAAERLMVKASCTLAVARDFVIFQWLLQGKPHALAGFLIQRTYAGAGGSAVSRNDDWQPQF